MSRIKTSHHPPHKDEGIFRHNRTSKKKRVSMQMLASRGSLCKEKSSVLRAFFLFHFMPSTFLTPTLNFAYIAQDCCIKFCIQKELVSLQGTFTIFMTMLFSAHFHVHDLNQESSRDFRISTNCLDTILSRSIFNFVKLCFSIEVFFTTELFYCVGTLLPTFMWIYVGWLSRWTSLSYQP